MASQTVVDLQDVGKVYEGAVPTRALEDVNLTIEAGEFVAILGPSGSGKSTLLHLLGALDTPTEGTVKIAGEDVSKLDDDGLARLRGRHLGFIFQFHHLMPDFTALENVLMPAFAVQGPPSPNHIEEAKSVLKRVGLEGKERSRVTNLSGGQQQRVAIARALVGGKTIVMADEPTGNLDSANGKEVFRLMREFNQRDGITFLVVTHDLALAMYADRIVHVIDGKIASDHPNDPMPLDG